MEGIRPVGFPAVRGLSAFPETNVRTYVNHNGVPGVWFFSLEAANAIACALARRFFSLPYFYARMGVAVRGESESRTKEFGEISRLAARSLVKCAARSLPASEPGSLEFFLVERYLLYAQRKGRLFQGRVFHDPLSFKPGHPVRCRRKPGSGSGNSSASISTMCGSRQASTSTVSFA